MINLTTKLCRRVGRRKATMNTETQSPHHVGSSAWLDSVYSILVNIGGASESMRGSFVQNHTDTEYPCTEWRFCGHLGYGGKYRRKTNKVDCYSEDETPKRIALIRELNDALAKLSNEALCESGGDKPTT